MKNSITVFTTRRMLWSVQYNIEDNGADVSGIVWDYGKDYVPYNGS